MKHNYTVTGSTFFNWNKCVKGGEVEVYINKNHSGEIGAHSAFYRVAQKPKRDGSLKVVYHRISLLHATSASVLRGG